MVNLKELSDSEKLENGCYEARVIIEVLGKPKEHVEETRNNIISQLESDKEMLITNKYLADTKEEDGLWSTFLEVELWFSSLKKLMQFSIIYMPSHIEILRPDQMILKTQDLSEVLSDFIQNLHTLNQVYHEKNIENDALKRTLGFMMKNSTLVALTRKPMNIEELSKYVGIAKDTLKPALDNLIKENRTELKGGLYYLVKKPSMKVEEISKENKESDDNKE